MRTLMIESVKAGEEHIQIEVVKSTIDLSQLVNLGMSVKELAQEGKAEFLTADGTQFRVTLLMQHSFIGWGRESKGNN